MVEIVIPTFKLIRCFRETLCLVPHGRHDFLVQREPYWRVLELRDLVDHDSGFRDIPIKLLYGGEGPPNLRRAKSWVCVGRVLRRRMIVALCYLSSVWARFKERNLGPKNELERDQGESERQATLMFHAGSSSSTRHSVRPSKAKES